MGKCNFWCIVAAGLGFAFLVSCAIALFFCCEKNGCNKSIVPFSEDFPAEKLNKLYFVDENHKEVPNDRSIIFIKDGVDFNDVRFSAPENTEEIHFCASEISISAEVLQKLEDAKIFLDCGKSTISIMHCTTNKSTETTK